MSHPKIFQRPSRKSYIGFLLLTTWAFLAQGVLATAPDSSYGENELRKDNEFPALVKRPAFFVGSRYGRSSGNGVSGGAPGSGNAGVGTSKSRRLIIVPRNDRFFLGSRYGKRSDEYLSPYEQNTLGVGLNKERSVDIGAEMENEKGSSSNGSRARPRITMTMSCVYTGISNFYRCSNANPDELNNIIMSHNDGMALDSSNSIASEDIDSDTLTDAKNK